MNTSRYLQRIGINHMPQPINLATLKELHKQHMLHVPFENLDVIRQVPILLDANTYYEKIVTNQRGGFCYELNGLFSWLLKSLGFHNHLIAATVHRSDGSWTKEGNHATQIVNLDQPYLVDVGFGDSFRQPLPLTGETREDISGVYRVIAEGNGRFNLQEKDEAHAWKTSYHFDMQPKQLTDFAKGCHFNQTSPKSNFTKKDVVTIATEDGRVTLSDHSLTITRHGNKQKIDILPEDKSSVLQKYFNIRL